MVENFQAQGPLNLFGLGLARTSVRGLGSTMRTIGTTTLEIFVPGSSREFPARPPSLLNAGDWSVSREGSRDEGLEGMLL